MVLEALALGRPVIATKVGALPEVKSDNLYLIDRLDEIETILPGGIKPKLDTRVAGDYGKEKIISEFEHMFESVIRRSDG